MDAISIKPGTFERSARTAGLIICALAMFASVQPELRATIRAASLSDRRSVLSTVDGNLLGDAVRFTVAKIRTRDALFIEIYEKPEEGTMKLVEKVQLADTRDGYFSFNGRATNLALTDIDGDGRPEILAPSFDADLIGRLNVYKYVPGSKGLQRIVQ